MCRAIVAIYVLLVKSTIAVLPRWRIAIQRLNITYCRQQGWSVFDHQIRELGFLHILVLLHPKHNSTPAFLLLLEDPFLCVNDLLLFYLFYLFAYKRFDRG